jgi:endonuclease-3
MAYNRLEKAIGVTPENLLIADEQEIKNSIRPAGMYNLRSKTLKCVSEEVIRRYDGDLSQVMEKTYTEARKVLMSLPGVGHKTADVVLLFSAGKKIVPVDRHIFRISKRLEIVSKNASYDEVRLSLEAITPKGMHQDLHIKLIQFGREYCKARYPKCSECFLDDICSYTNKNR